MRSLFFSLIVATFVLVVPGVGHAQDGTYPSAGYPVQTVPSSGLTIPTRTAARLRALDADLATIATRSQGRVVDGSLQIAAGVAFTTIGIFVDDALFRSLLVLTGSVGIARGVTQIAVLPDGEGYADRFAAMPLDNADQVRAKVRYGEDALFHLARRTRAARLTDGLLTMGGAAAYVPLYWGLRHREDSDYRFGDEAVDYIGLAVSSIAFAAGLVSVIVKSYPERRAIAYRKMVTRFEQERPGELEQLSFVPRLSVGLAARGGAVSARWQF